MLDKEPTHMYCGVIPCILPASETYCCKDIQWGDELSTLIFELNNIEQEWDKNNTSRFVPIGG